MAVLYFGTGFNSVNVCGNYAALNSAKSYRTEPLDLLDQLPYAVLRVSRNMGGNSPGAVDYVELNGYHYYVLSYVWLDADVVQYNLALDPFYDLRLDIIAGIIERSPDSFAVNEDPYLTPINPPQVYAVAMWGKDQDQPYDVWNLVASTLDFSSFPPGGEDDVKDIVELGEDNIVRSIWSPKAVVTGTPISMFGVAAPGIALSCVTPGYRLYNMDNPDVRRAIQIARNCGWESAILGAYQVPKSFIPALLDNGINGIGAIKTDASAMPTYDMREYDPAARREDWKKVAWKSPAAAGGIISCAGGSQLSLRPWQYGPMHLAVDPRLGGGPTCILDDPTLQTGLASGNTAQVPLTVRAVQGAEWVSTPITYVQASGINRQSRDLVRNQVYSMQKDMLEIQKAQFSGLASAMPAVSDAFHQTPLASIPSGIMTMGNASPAAALSAGAGLLKSMASTQMAVDDIYNVGRAQRQYEKDSYYIGVNYTAPQTIGIPQASMQDFMGNGFVCYFNTFSVDDLNRWVEIAKMFGLSDNRPARGYSLPEDGAKCHYLQIAGCRLKGMTIQTQVAEAMLAAGVRIWNTLPSEGVD